MYRRARFDLLRLRVLPAAQVCSDAQNNLFSLLQISFSLLFENQVPDSSKAVVNHSFVRQRASRNDFRLTEAEFPRDRQRERNRTNACEADSHTITFLLQSRCASVGIKTLKSLYLWYDLAQIKVCGVFDEDRVALFLRSSAWA